jgi:fibronectin type 3 domain-containing protein
MKLKLFALWFLLTLPMFAQHTVTLTWSWTQGSGGVGTGFEVQRGTVSGGPYTTIATIASPTTLTYVDTASTTNVLTEGSTYYYVVLTTGNGGTLSAPSNQATATIPFLLPVGPTGLSAVAK